jgi:integrase
MSLDDDISAFYRPEKRRWIVKYKDLGGEWRSKTTSAEIRTERAALDWGRGWLAEIRASGKSPVKRAGNAGPTVSEIKERWLKLRRDARVNGEPEFKPATLAGYEWHLEVIEETFTETFKGEMPLGKLDDQQARAWVKTLKATNAPNTCGNIYSTLRSLIEDAIAERWVILAANPLALDAVKRELPPRKPLTGKRPIFVELDQMQTLLGCGDVPDHRRVRYLVDVCTGLSEGELAGRIWSDAIMTDKPTLDIMSACAIHGEKGWATQSTTKNEHRVRTLPLHSAAAEALLWWWREGWAQYVGKPPKLTDPIFPGPSGDFSRPASAALLRQDLRAAGCADKRYGHNITAQALRRCFATYLDAVDVPEEQRGRLLGHAKKTVTAKHYTNEQIETDRRAVELIALRWVPAHRLVSGLVSRLVAPTPKPSIIRAAFEIRTRDLRFTKSSTTPSPKCRDVEKAYAGGAGSAIQQRFGRLQRSAELRP